MSSSGLVRPPGSSDREAQVTSYVPIFEESSETVPWPSMSEPSQCAFAVRVVAMTPILPHGGAARIINP